MAGSSWVLEPGDRKAGPAIVRQAVWLEKGLCGKGGSLGRGGEPQRGPDTQQGPQRTEGAGGHHWA